MLDVLYVIGTVLFFALMRAYVAVCERLGRSTDHDTDATEARS